MRAFASFVLFLCCMASAFARGPESGKFDYFALALSWSPTYCATPAGENDRSQCSPGRRFAFVVHGLWPQHEKGWPEYCETRESWVDEKNIAAMMDVMNQMRATMPAHRAALEATADLASAQSEVGRHTGVVTDMMAMMERALPDAGCM